MSDSDTTSKDSAQFQVGCSPVCDVVRKPRRRKRKARSWHRVLGIFSAIPLTWVLLTGLALNHADDLSLDSVELKSPLILSAYGMTPSGEALSAKVHGHSVTAWDGLVFFDEAPLALNGEFITAFSLSEDSVVVSDQSVLRLDSKGELIEMLDELSLPALPILEAGIFQGSIALRTEDTWYSADEDWLEFSEISGPVTPITAPTLGEGQLKNTLQASWAGGGISLSRFLLDLHSANFLGRYSAYFYDFVVLCTLWLIGSGLLLQYRTNRRSRVSS